LISFATRLQAAARSVPLPSSALRCHLPLALVAITCLTATCAPVASAADPLVHKPAPTFVRTGLDHKPLDLRAYRGKVVLLNFWATWCAPCQVEMPHFVDWQRTYGSRGLQIIGISMDDDPAPVRNLYQKLHLNYPVAMGDARLGMLYGGVLGLPVTFLIDRSGNIQAEFQGETSLRQIESTFRPMLKQP
jgi:cytochrome c biogenesis protein CcmG, thiol:disulfide interchange protein DsbE